MRLTPLLEATYRDKALVPVIVEAAPSRFKQVRDRLSGAVPRVKEIRALFPRLRSPQTFTTFTSFKAMEEFRMVALAVPPPMVEEIAEWGEVKRIYPDIVKYAMALPEQSLLLDGAGVPFTSTYHTKRALGLQRASEAGVTGKGIGVAVIDTGCRASHPQLRGVTALSAMKEKGGTGRDANGHGTWVAATLGGSYEIDPRYNVPVEGMAPECTLFSIQSLGFVIGMGTASDTIQAMEMALLLDVKVISMSLGGGVGIKDEDNPESVAIAELVRKNKIPVVAAGNSGPKHYTVSSPGSVELALTVGSVDHDGLVSEFSSRGPTEDGHIKPDVLSYGDRIDSALTGYLDGVLDKTQLKYGILSGTSMATPHDAGLVTCMAQVWKEKNLPFDVYEVKRMMGELGQPKDDISGWGLMTWGMVEEWLDTEHGWEPLWVSG